MKRMKRTIFLSAAVAAALSTGSALPCRAGAIWWAVPAMSGVQRLPDSIPADGNLSGDGSETNYSGNGASFSYCLSSDAAPEGSEGCIVGRPVFNPRRPLYLDYHAAGRGQGSVLGYEDRLLAATDFFGEPRVKFVSRRGVADIDIGATESKYTPATTLFILR